MAAFLEPTAALGDRSQVLLGYLDFFRATVVEKVTGLSDAALRDSVLPSGWTLLELVKHLVFMERRWLVWGFLGEPVDSPWGDHSDDGRWAVSPAESLNALLGALETGGRRTRQIVEGAALSDAASASGRFADDAEAPVLERILLHVLQEYARHCGHLDVVRELLDGAVGE